MKKGKTAVLLALGALLAAMAWAGERAARRRAAAPPKGWDLGLDGRRTLFCQD